MTRLLLAASGLVEDRMTPRGVWGVRLQGLEDLECTGDQGQCGVSSGFQFKAYLGVSQNRGP